MHWKFGCHMLAQHIHCPRAWEKTLCLLVGEGQAQFQCTGGFWNEFLCLEGGCSSAKGLVCLKDPYIAVWRVSSCWCKGPMQCLGNLRSISEVIFLCQPLHGDEEAAGNDLHQRHLRYCPLQDCGLRDMRGLRSSLCSGNILAAEGWGGDTWTVSVAFHAGCAVLLHNMDKTWGRCNLQYRQCMNFCSSLQTVFKPQIIWPFAERWCIVSQGSFCVRR